MTLSKALLGAILVGVAVQTTGCKKGEMPKPKEEQAGQNGNTSTSGQTPDNCPACGRG